MLKKRWHGIPVAIMSAVLAIVLIAGSAIAAFTVLSGQTEVEVKESITADYSIFGEWTPIPNPFELTLEPYYPGESDIGYYRVYNKSFVGLPISVTITGVPLDWELAPGSNLDLTRSGGVWTGLVTVPAATYTGVHPDIVLDTIGMVEFTITMTVPTDVQPEPVYTFQVAIARE